METDLSCKIDYYRATTRDFRLIRKQTHGHFSEGNCDKTGSLYRYRNSLTNRDTSAVYLFNGITEAMGTCIQLSGEPISKLMDKTALPSVPALLSLGIAEWKVTRLDIAIDCFHPDLRPRDFYKALDRKDMQSCFREWNEVAKKDLDKGHTIYGGGKESEKQLRVYDKSAEQGREGVWTRYEMVFAGERAVDAWSAIQAVQSDEALLPVGLSMLASLVDFPRWRLWRNIFGSEEAHKWIAIPRSESGTWTWLKKQVAPALRHQFDVDKDWTMLNEFVRYVKQGIEAEKQSLDKP